MSGQQVAAGQRLLIACSGGLDSTVLVHLAKRAGFSFVIAHVNFGLRGAESDRDEAFVRELALQLQVDCHVTGFATEEYAQQQQLSIQEAARILRYKWFAQLRNELQCKWILTAHQADDNIETLVHHFFRGTGIDGLTGIPPVDRQRGLLRPLISISREDLEQYAAEHDIRWVTDSSNRESKYTRNVLRHELFPLLERIYPTVRSNLGDNIRRFQGIAQLYHEQTEALKKKLGRHEGLEWRVPVRQLLKYRHTSLLYEILRQYGFGERQLPELLKLCDAPSGRYLANEQWQIIRHRAWLIFAEVQKSGETMVIREGDAEIHFGGGFLKIRQLRKEAHQLSRLPSFAQLDAQQLAFPLILRKWKPGDYFYPFGMRKKKKLARFLIDQKLSKNEKESVWVLESAGRIAWVVGHRIDDRFRIGDHTRSLCVITIENQVGRG